MFCLNIFERNMSSLVEGFVQAPSVKVPDKCTKEQLLSIAEHNKIQVDKGYSGGQLGGAACVTGG